MLICVEKLFNCHLQAIKPEDKKENKSKKVILVQQTKFKSDFQDCKQRHTISFPLLSKWERISQYILTNVLNPKPLHCLIGQPQITRPNFHNTKSYQHWPQREHKLIGETFYVAFSNDGCLINLWNAALCMLELQRRLAERIKVISVDCGGIRKM